MKPPKGGFKFIVLSYRTDQFLEQETFNNSSKFQLTLKRISLSEARHKEKLVTELDKVEAEFKAVSKSNVNGKIINYGNGVSIDTDDVIYLEKGSEFHSYTFRVNNENAPDNAPIENLVISSHPDGTWEEVLLTYYLSFQERQNLISEACRRFYRKSHS